MKSFFFRDSEIEVLKNMLENKLLEVNPSSLQSTSKRTPLHFACGTGQLKVTKLLIQHGANLESRDFVKNTPLLEACFNKNIDLIKVLILSGANVNSRNKIGFTPLIYACTMKWNIIERIECVKLLLEHGANPNIKSVKNKVPIEIACLKNQVEIVDLLLKHGSSMNVKIGKSNTLLHHSCQYGFKNLMLVFMKHGADPNIKDELHMDTPLHKACRSGFYDIAYELIQRGAIIEAQNKDGRTSLHYACTCDKNTDLIKMLIDNGSSRTMKDNEGNLPIQLCSSEDNRETMLYYLPVVKFGRISGSKSFCNVRVQCFQ